MSFISSKSHDCGNLLFSNGLKPLPQQSIFDVFRLHKKRMKIPKGYSESINEAQKAYVRLS